LAVIGNNLSDRFCRPPGEVDATPVHGEAYLRQCLSYPIEWLDARPARSVHAGPHAGRFPQTIRVSRVYVHDFLPGKVPQLKPPPADIPGTVVPTASVQRG
jgi:hypothetical protein